MQTQTDHLVLRAPPVLRERLTLITQNYGGTLAERVRLACYIHDAQATLTWLRSPRGAQLPDDERQAAIETAAADLARWTETAFPTQALVAEMQ